MKKIMFYLFEKRYCDCDCPCNYSVSLSAGLGDIAFLLLKGFANGLFWFTTGFLLMWGLCEAMLARLGY